MLLEGVVRRGRLAPEAGVVRPGVRGGVVPSALPLRGGGFPSALGVRGGSLPARVRRPVPLLLVLLLLVLLLVVVLLLFLLVLLVMVLLRLPVLVLARPRGVLHRIPRRRLLGGVSRRLFDTPPPRRLGSRGVRERPALSERREIRS